MREERLQRVPPEQVQGLEARVREQLRPHLRMLRVQQQEQARRVRVRQPALRAMHSTLRLRSGQAPLQPCAEPVMFCFDSRECLGV